MRPGPIGFYCCTQCGRHTWNANDIKYGYCGACKLCQADTAPDMRPESFPPIWTIHARPRDYPDHFVVRVSWGPWHEARVQLAGTLELARMAVQMEGGSWPLARAESDSPNIVECWV